jgi:hypothetical protein
MWAKSAGADGGSGYFPATPAPSRERLGDFEIELRAPRAAGDIIAEWRDLEERAVEPNLFAGPDFLAAATTHLNAHRDLKVLLLWGGGSLEGAIPIAGFAAREVHVPQVEPGSPGVPLLDGKRPGAILEAACAWLGRRHSILVLQGLPAESAFVALTRDFARQSDRRLTPVEPSDRNAAHRSASRLNEAPDLDPDGRITLDRAIDPADIRLAVEEYLVLEAQAALAAGRSAAIQLPGQANLVRTVTRQLARRRQCQVFTLRIAGRAAAAAIVVIEPRIARIWKSACDPQWPVEPLRALMSGRITKLMTRRAAIENVVDFGGDVPALASYRLALKPGEQPDGIARRLGERVRRSADSIAGSIVVAASRRLSAARRKPAA